MNRNQLVTYGVGFCAGGKGRRNSKAFALPQPPSDAQAVSSSIPRIARLMALAIRLTGFRGGTRFAIMPNWPASAG